MPPSKVLCVRPLCGCRQAGVARHAEAHALYCLRNARLAALDPACTFLQADLRPPGVNLYLLEAVHEDDESG